LLSLKYIENSFSDVAVKRAKRK